MRFAGAGGEGRGDGGRGAAAWALLWVCLAAAGCHHRKAQPIVLPQQTPVALEPVTPANEPPLLETAKPKLPPVPVAEAASKPKPKKKRVKTAATTVAPPPPDASTQVASAEAPSEAAAIGDLTPGGEQAPQTQHEATDLITDNDKRLKGLPETKLKAQRSLVSKVRNFQKQAQQALRSGDLEGAKTLATKAKLLLDDLEKDDAG